MHHLGHWPLGCCCFRCICIVCICSHISCCYSPFFQGRCAFASKVAHLRDPEIRKLAEGLPLRAAKAKAPSTTERYSRAFQKFREWSACFEEVVCLPSDELSVALYLEFFATAEFPILRTGVRLLWHKLGTQFVWISKSLRFKTGKERA